MKHETFVRLVDILDGTWLDLDHVIVMARGKPGNLRLVVGANVNDVFVWGCSDFEDMETDEDVDQFEQALTDLLEAAGLEDYKMALDDYKKAASSSNPDALVLASEVLNVASRAGDESIYDAAEHAGALYAARRRGLRPQGACYPKDTRLWHLFDQCGPEREVGFGNPFAPGEYDPQSERARVAGGAG